jgi:protein phosphatase
VRSHNEDCFEIDREHELFVVADGMGGHSHGEVASRMAVEAMGEEAGTRGEERVTTLIREANRRIFARSSEDAAASGMGTTMTAALVGDYGVVTIGHVGDSRAYLLREGRLEQLTEDHSLVAELVRTGKLSAEEAERHPQRSVITRALGTDPEVDVDTFTVDAQAGDLFLLCSDGLTTMVDDEEILRTVEGSRDDLEHAAQVLVRKANRGGGEDNITVVFFELAEDGAESSVDDADTLTEADRVPVVTPPRTAGNDLDRTAKRVLSILAVVAFVAVGIAVLLLGLK